MQKSNLLHRSHHDLRIIDYQKIKQLEQRSINAENRVKELEKELSESINSGGNSTMASSSRQTGNSKNNQKVVSDFESKSEGTRKTAQEDKVKIKQVENKLEKLNKTLLNMLEEILVAKRLLSDV